MASTIAGMSKEAPPSRTAPQFIVRMPDEEFRNKIAEAAKSNNRSMNAEILARLEQSFSGDSSALGASLEAQVAMTKTMATFVIGAVDMAGPQKGAVAEVFRLMKEAAHQVQAGSVDRHSGPFIYLYVALTAIVKKPDDRDVEEYVPTVLRRFRELEAEAVEQAKEKVDRPLFGAVPARKRKPKA